MIIKYFRKKSNTQPTARMTLGAAAEDAVCAHLKYVGYRILDRNWRRPWGELDIVALKDDIIHIIEVKASKQLVAGFAPTVRADHWKMHKVRRTAITWLSTHHYSPDTPWQITVASVIMETTPPSIELLPWL